MSERLISGAITEQESAKLAELGNSLPLDAPGVRQHEAGIGQTRAIALCNSCPHYMLHGHWAILAHYIIAITEQRVQNEQGREQLAIRCPWREAT